MNASPIDFRPTCNLENLRRRSDLLSKTREFFRRRGFLEVQTPVISQFCVVDRHLEPFVIHDQPGVKRMADAGCLRYLQTSPEAAMKRLLAAGSPSIYQLGPVFRQGEYGKLHNPEFTMLEWYQVGERYEEGIQFADQLLQELLGTQPAEVLSYQEAFRRGIGIDPLDASLEDLARWSIDQKLVGSLDWSSDRDDWLDLILSHSIQPTLGFGRPSFLMDFPASQSALARLKSDDERVCERFELFVDGIEIANGYHELLDAQVLLERSRTINEGRIRDGKVMLPVEGPLLDAMRHGLPKSVGCALGFDRLVMLACNACTIQEVIPFPWDQA